MAEGDSSLESLRKAMQYPLIKVRAETCRGDPRRCPHLCRARQNCDMPEEMRQDCVDLVITAIERFQGNYEVRACGARSPCRLGFSSPPPLPLSMVLRLPRTSQSAARLVKETMDKKYNESWVVVIGQGFAFEVTHEVKHVLWMFLSDLSALVYKGAALCRVTRPLPTPRPPPLPNGARRSSHHHPRRCTHLRRITAPWQLARGKQAHERGCRVGAIRGWRRCGCPYSP